MPTLEQLRAMRRVGVGRGVPVPSGQVHFWPLDAANGGDDLVGGANGGLTDVTFGVDQNGVANGAAVFNGTTSRVAIGNIAGFPAAAGTVTGWFLADDWTDGQIRTAFRGFVTGNLLVLRKIVANDAFQFIYQAGGGTVELQSHTFVPSGPAGFFHCAFTWSAAADETEMFVDGGSVASDTASAGALVGTLDFDIGSQGASNLWDGRISNVRVFDRVLTPTEINTLFLGGL